MSQHTREKSSRGLLLRVFVATFGGLFAIVFAAGAISRLQGGPAWEVPVEAIESAAHNRTVTFVLLLAALYAAIKTWRDGYRRWLFFMFVTAQCGVAGVLAIMASAEIAGQWPGDGSPGLPAAVLLPLFLALLVLNFLVARSVMRRAA